MNTNIGRSILLGTLGLALCAGPALAQHGGHAGGGHAGGGHAGGGHAGVAHAGGGHAAGGHYGGVQHYSARGGASAYRGGGGAAVGASYHYAARGSYGYPGAYHYGYSTGAYWHGGYWHGGFWPGAFYGAGFAWFLPVLPAVYGTYWWGGVPYYYANDVYYTWNPGYDGHVATDPPPAADPSDGSAVPPGAPPTGAPPPGAESAPMSAPMSAPDAGGQIFMYPKNGQSAEQQSTDRRECQQWAASQAGGDAAHAPDYRRAMVACVEGRGYSAN